MSLQPQLLNIFETHYLPLHSKLRPAMRGFVIALLPALEEEGSEFFDKVRPLLYFLCHQTIQNYIGCHFD